MLPVACRSLSRIRDAVAGGVLAVVVLSAVTARGAASAPAPEPAPGPLPVAASAPRASAPPSAAPVALRRWLACRRGAGRGRDIARRPRHARRWASGRGGFRRAPAALRRQRELGPLHGELHPHQRRRPARRG